MSVEEPAKQPSFSDIKETDVLARTIIRSAMKGSLATLLTPGSHPYASLLLTATTADGTPIFLISKLALHTRNLLEDARASLLIDATGTEADPMQGSRITLVGEARPVTDESVARRFLARHPSAAGYASFPDFSFYTLQVETAHYIGGFGRIFDLPREQLLVDLSGAEALVEAEQGIVSHMNEDHADAIGLYATQLLGAPAGDWRMTGVDPEGCDLVLGARALRLRFAARVSNGDEVRKELVRLVGVARDQAA
ncbi:HugZ family protein [Hyphomicrobium sulfonivorans]|uniref:HugZ family pyridoxamine 5'-phosphate oxidase n=1 Tax=Hyphomicrobium sulfonivorans TaxID=121290 RepID=UPI00156FB775|nr:DUF2470 domain-containing protein [Hyphomicrobium sulfonivorans]MBI1649517.1 HugZ family protein [Hyphomicrobium sulfonivorans]NSL71433.1 pyridoxamine 5'-phosphate oxidase [Hyphomicrobium sulfonivorans]